MNQDKFLELNIYSHLKSLFQNWLFLFIVLGIFFSVSNSFCYSNSVVFKEQGEQFIKHSLIGILINKTPSSSMVVLRHEKTGETKFYRMGDDISGFVITQIYIDRIILQEENESLQIFLENGFSDGTSSEYKMNIESNESDTNKERSNKSDPKKGKTLGEKYISLKTTKIILNEWPLIQREARFTPYFEEGKVKGLKIKSLLKNSILSEIGILENDVINEINGIAINDSTNLIQLMNKCRSSDQIKVEIERDALFLSLIFILR